MAGFVYDTARAAFLGTASGQINWTNDTIKAVLVSSSYSPNSASDQFLSIVQAATGSLTGQTLSSKTVTAGVAQGSNVTFSAVPAGFTWNYALLYKDTGSVNTSPLIALLDSGSATGLPLISSGGDITLSWNVGANGIFKL